MDEVLKLMSASGVTRCQYSMVHQDRDAVAWIEVMVCGVAQRYLACAECADLHAKRGGTTITDVRKVAKAEPEWSSWSDPNNP